MSSVESKGMRRLELDDPEAGVLAYSVEGKISAEQGQELFERVRAAANEGRRLRLYYEIHGFPTAEAGVYLDKLKAIGTIWRTIERMAIVGDQRWLGVYTAMFDPITKPDLKHFKTGQKDAALAWIRE